MRNQYVRQMMTFTHQSLTKMIRAKHFNFPPWGMESARELVDLQRDYRRQQRLDIKLLLMQRLVDLTSAQEASTKDYDAKIAQTREYLEMV